MGCSGSKSPGPTAGTKHIDYKNLPVEEDNYPPPYTPELTRREIYDTEVNKDLQRKIDNIPKGTDRNFTTLLKYLSDGATKEVHHVTAIYLWMKSQDYKCPSLDQEKLGDTPRGYIKLVKEGDLDLTSFFTILCRRSGIPCRIVSGLGKGNEYFLGAQEQTMYTKWCSVFADEEWRLVHVDWAVAGGKDNNQNDSQDKCSDFFFFTDPEDFATFCLPENFRWQLVKKPFSKKEFLNLPAMRPLFFALNTTIIQPKSGNSRTHSGKVEIEMTFPKKILDKVFLGYLLSYSEDHEETDSGSINIPTALEKYVFMNRKPSRVVFEIFLPVPGRYLLDIYGDVMEAGHKKTDHVLERLCQFRIFSDRKFKSGELEPLPESPDIGWGPGPMCRQLGLIPLSHFDSCLFMKPGEVRDIKFRMTRNLDVLAQLTHNYVPVYQLAEQVECTQSDGEVNVRVRIPEDGQYALKIFCREAGSNEFDEACIYLIRQREKSRLPENYERGHRRKYRDKMLRTRLEHHLNNHTSQKELEDALNMFICYNVPDNGEKKKAEDKLKQYWEIKKELYWCTRGRNANVIRKWVEKARNSKFESDLQEDIQRAEHLDENLMKLKGYTHPIARMDPHTMIEIRNYKRPPKIVHDVMTSTYLLLGERRDDLEEWEQIQYLMGKQGKEYLQKRIMDRSPEDVHIEIADQADNVIRPYNLKKCREVSNGIGSFYRWNKQFINDVRKQNMNEHEQNEIDKSLSGRETFRESTSPANSAREPASVKSQSQNESVDEPFAIEQDNDGVSKEEPPNRKFFMTILKPTQKPQETPIAYAGWKPSEYQ